MPYAMTHFIVANNIIKKTTIINDYEKFFLGSISPDSVHTRKNYSNTMKEQSHFCRQGDSWGKIKDCKAWLENVYNQANIYKEMVDMNFFIGYVTHIITDIFFDEYVTKRYRKLYLNGPLTANDYKILDTKQLNNDIEMFNNYEDSDFILESLNNCTYEKFSDIVTLDDTQSYKEIVTNRYYNQTIQPIEMESKFVHLTIDENMKFVNDFSDVIVQNVSKLL